MVKPDLSELTLSQLAELVRGNARTVRRRCADAGVKPCRQDGRALFFRPHEALRAYFTLGGEEGLDPQAEKARLDRARAEAQEMKNAEARGELAPILDCETAGLVLFGGVVQRLDAIPTTIAVELAAESSPPACEAIVRDALHEARGEIADARIVTPKGRYAKEIEKLLSEFRLRLAALVTGEQSEEVDAK